MIVERIVTGVRYCMVIHFINQVVIGTRIEGRIGILINCFFTVRCSIIWHLVVRLGIPGLSTLY